MASITTREVAGTGATVKGTPLTNAEIDNNFININTELETLASTPADAAALAFAIALG